MKANGKKLMCWHGFIARGGKTSLLFGSKWLMAVRIINLFINTLTDIKEACPIGASSHKPCAIMVWKRSVLSEQNSHPWPEGNRWSELIPGINASCKNKTTKMKVSLRMCCNKLGWRRPDNTCVLTLFENKTSLTPHSQRPGVSNSFSLAIQFFLKGWRVYHRALSLTHMP